ncbi:non-ribosomal peptide synthetase (plasmid) [Streptomyces viridifaciens]|nr:non-ribosomal peptide synthetase [Streptomyces viridifaciens]
MQPDPVHRIALSDAQTRMWISQRAEPDNPGWNMAFGWRLEGGLDTVALREALERLVERHEVLRQRFAEVDGSPTALSGSETLLDLVEHDLATVPDDDIHDRTRALLDEATNRVFDLSAGPPMRLLVVRERPSTHVLYIVVHHIAFDGQSQEIFTRDLSRLYVTVQSGAAGPAPLESSYAEYAVAERSDSTRVQAVEHWTDVLRGVEPAELPMDYPPSVGGATMGTHSISISPKTSDALRSMASEQRSTLFMVALAGLEVTLSRFTGAADVIVGTPVGTRDRTDLDEVIGLFFNPVLIPGRVDQNLRVAAFLEAVRDATLDAFQYANAPFNDVIAALNPRRSNDGSAPLFQSWFEIEQDNGAGLLALPGIEATPVADGRPALRSDLDVTVQVRDTGLVARFNYRSDKFRLESVERIGAVFAQVLESMARHQDMTIGELGRMDWLRDPRMREICVGEAREVGSDLLSDIFRGSEEYPDRLAVVQGDVGLSYRELLDKSRGVADILLRRGLGAEDVVAIYMARRPEMLPAMLGTMLAGCAYLPLDPDLPSERLTTIVEDAAPRVIITDRSDGSVSAWAQHTVLVSEVLGADRTLDDYPGMSVEGAHLAYVMYTSGSTGKPKGVMIERAGLTNFVHWCARGYDSWQGNGAPVFTSVAFDAVIPNLFGPLLFGEAVHMMPAVTDLGDLGDELVRGGPYNYIKLTPQHLDVLATQLSAAEASALCGRLVVGADRFSRSTLERWRALDPDTPILNEYGPTEITVANSTYEVDGAIDAEVLPIGRPIPGTSMWILDEDLRPVPPGGVGEICIGGVGVARGYLHRPSATAGVFVPDPLSPDSGARIYRTGDYGRVGPDGQFEFRGRRDHQVKVRGFRIEPAEVEHALTSEDEVAAAHVTGHTSRDGTTELIAYIVTDRPIEDRDLRRRLRDSLPHYQVPSRFLRVPEIPLTPHGKVETSRLPDPALPSGDVGRAEASRDAVTTPLQRIWADVLDVDDVQPHDNFFELGGHSLLALKLIVRVEEATGKKITLREVFESPTVAEMAAALGREQDSVREEPEVSAAGPEGVHPLTPDQTRILFAQEASGSATQYNIVSAWTLSGPLDVHVLDQAVRLLVARHAALRTRIEPGDGAFVQVVGPTQETDIRHVDLTSRDGEAARRRLRRLVEELDRVEFALGRSLVRIRLVRLAPTEHAVVMAGHHMLLDGWSMGLLLRDLGELYTALSEGRDADLPALRVSFPGLAAGGPPDHAPAASPAPLRAAVAEPVVLPTDRPRRADEPSAGEVVRGLIPARCWEGVRKVARARGTTPFVVLLACAQVVIAEYSSTESFSFGFSDAGRDDPRVLDVVGPFFKHAVGVADLRGEPTLTELIGRVAAGMSDTRARLADTAERSGPAPAQSVWFEMEPEEGASSFPAALTVAEFVLPTVEVKNDLVFSLRECQAGVEVSVAYRASLFEQRTAEALRDRFIRLADVVESFTDRRISELTREALPSTSEPGQGVEGQGDSPADVLVELAADLLNVRSVSAVDNFFDLGGDSVKAVAYVARAAQRGFNLTVRDLVGRASFAELAAESPTRTASPATAKSAQPSSLVELRAPIGGRRLICIQPSGGTVPWYFTLAEVLPDGAGLSAFVALEDRWLGETQVSVEQMAETFADELCRELEGTPFTILGWSASGVWAVELARQLRARNVPVESLVLVEPALPDVAGRAAIRRAWSDFSQAADLVDELHQDGISTHDRTLLRKQLEDLVASSDVLAASVPELTSSGPLRMSAAIELAQLSYTLRPYEGTAELVVSAEVTGAGPARPSKVAGTSHSAYLERWRAAFPTGALNVHRVGGGHMSMIQEKEHAAEIAGIVARLWGSDMNDALPQGDSTEEAE